jgi:hypothetical protein
MIVIVGLLVLILAALAAVAGVAANSGTAHPLGDNFTIFGLHLSGLSTGQLFLYGIVVGVLGMLGLSMLLGAFTRRAASRGSRRELKVSRRETTALRLDRDRLTQQLEDERAERAAADTSTTVNAPPPPGQTTTPPDQADESGPPKPVLAERTGVQ